jgi:hypothetical protein
VTEEFLHRAGVEPGLQHVGSERVPQGVRGDRLRDLGSSGSVANCSLDHAPMEGIAVRCIG